MIIYYGTEKLCNYFDFKNYDFIFEKTKRQFLFEIFFSTDIKVFNNYCVKIKDINQGIINFIINIKNYDERG